MSTVASTELRFEGRVALVTGAARGLGRSHAEQLAERGAHVFLNDLPERADQVEEVREGITRNGGKASAALGKVGVDEQSRAVVDTVVREGGRIDVLVHNAGLPGGGLPIDADVQDSPTQRLDDLYDVNIRGPLQLNRAAWPHLTKQGYGRILFVSSATATGWTQGPHGFEIDYSSAKAAAIAVGKQTAGAGKAHGISVNILMPWAYTPAIESGIGGSELGEWMRLNTPVAKVSAGVLALVHERCPVTGEIFAIGGGRIARVFFASTRGVLEPDITPEKVLAALPAATGTVGPDGELEDVFELSMPRELRVMMQMAADSRIPDLSWIARQDVDVPAAFVDEVEEEPAPAG